MKSNKKMIIILASVIGVIVLLIIILMLVANGGTKNLDYSAIEERIKMAGENYYRDHENELPETGTKTMNISKLITDGYLSDINKKLKDGVTCNGTLYVTKTVTDYSYRAKLDCGSAYSTKTLSSVLLENIVSNGSGLYKTEEVNPDNPSEMHNVYIFRGDNVNNYIKLGDFYWEIIKVYENGEIAVLGDAELLRNLWDNRYNVETDYYHGINKYDVSRVKDAIVEDVLNFEDGYNIIKSLITTHTACYGNRYLDDTSKDGSAECSKTLPNQYFSLLPIYDYMNASLDGNCNKVMDNSCYNYNFLSNHHEEWWTITGVADNTEEVYSIDSVAEREYASVTKGIRLYAHFDPSVMYVSGSGTYEDPYIVK